MRHDVKLRVLYVIKERAQARRCTCAECIAWVLSTPFKNIHRNLRRYLDQGLIQKIRSERGHSDRAQYLITQKGVRRYQFFMRQEKQLSLT